MHSVIFLMGPTASGKTDLAISVAKRFPVDIISVDSAMIYRGMDIGTGKPSQETLNSAPHALIDICSPDESYSVEQFCNDATTLIRQSHAQNRLPLLVGGTMLYFKALLTGLAPLPSANEQIRKELTEEAFQFGWDRLHQELAHVDPIAANRIHPNDPQRIQRALEVYRLTGKTLTAHFSAKRSYIEKKAVVPIALYPEDKTWLHERIEKRFIDMLSKGFVEEVESIVKNFKLTVSSPSLRCVGYRQIWDYLQGKTQKTQMIEQAITATRQLAKRQYTWLRSWSDLHLIDPEKIQNEDFLGMLSCWLKTQAVAL